jgi:hypothetical protein
LTLLCREIRELVGTEEYLRADLGFLSSGLVARMGTSSPSTTEAFTFMLAWTLYKDILFIFKNIILPFTEIT